jgi:hypothetical protein
MTRRESPSAGEDFRKITHTTCRQMENDTDDGRSIVWKSRNQLAKDFYPARRCADDDHHRRFGTVGLGEFLRRVTSNCHLSIRRTFFRRLGRAVSD